MEPLRLGVLGTGFIGERHARNAAASGAVELVGVASLHSDAARQLARELDCRACSPSELMAVNDIEAVVVASRTSDHAAHAVEVLEHGKHLLLEKPGAINIAGHELISAAASRQPGLTVRVAYHRRHDPGFRELARRVGAGESVSRSPCTCAAARTSRPADADRFGGRLRDGCRGARL